jgi:hypothetical protein
MWGRNEAMSERVAWRVESGIVSVDVISKPLLWFLALAVLGILIVTWWAGGYPARVAIINQNFTARNIVLAAGGRHFAIGDMKNGETRIVRIPSGDNLEVRFTGTKPRVWRSPEPLPPGISVVLYIRADDRVDMEGKIGR